MSQEREIVFTYDVGRHAVTVRSPITGLEHCFRYDAVWDFVDWLRTDRHMSEKWGTLEMDYRYALRAKTVVCCEGDGRHVDVFAFSAALDEYQAQVDRFADAVREVEVRLVQPAQTMRSKGMLDQEIAMALRNRAAFDLPSVWQSGSDG